MATGIRNMYRTGSWSGSDYCSGGTPSVSRSSSTYSSDGIRTGPSASAPAPPSTCSGSDSGLGFIQSLAQWIREHLGIATPSFNFLSVCRYLYLVGLLLIAAFSTLTEVCFMLISALLIDSDCEITMAIARNAVLSLREISCRCRVRIGILRQCLPLGETRRTC